MSIPDHLAVVFEHMPDAVLLTDIAGRITSANAQSAALFGYAIGELLGSDIEMLVPEQQREAHRHHRELYARQRQIRRMGSGLVLSGRRKDGSVFPVEISLSPFDSRTGVQVISIVRDVTERVSLEQALREGEERYRSLVELSPEAIVVHSLGIIIYVNEATVRLFNVRSRDDLIGRSFLDFVPPQSIDEVRRRMQNPPDPGAKREPMLVRSRRADGSEFILEALGSRVTYRGQPAGQVILRDITERVRAEQELTTSREQLRDLSTYLQSAREAERASIAREIHDELGGALTALKMDLAMIDDIFPPTGQTSLRAALQEKVDSMAELIDSTVKTMRRIVTALRPVLLDSLGLNAAIEWHAEDFQHRTGIACTVQLPAEDMVLDPERSTAVYRIFQEALTNVARHAGATRIDASLHVERSVLLLTVSDNGKGIRPDQLANTKSFGIMGMRERALIFGGEVTLTGIPGTGTTMSLRLPL